MLLFYNKKMTVLFLGETRFNALQELNTRQQIPKKGFIHVSVNGPTLTSITAYQVSATYQAFKAHWKEMEEFGIEDIVLNIDNLIKEALSVYLLEQIGSSSLCCHFASQPLFQRKTFNKQEIEVLSHGTVQGKNLTRHLLYKLIKYTLPAENHIMGSRNPSTTLTATTFEDVERLHQQHVITDFTFKEYETLNDSIFPAIERLTNGEMTSKSTSLTIQLLAYLLKTYTDEDFQAFIICLLLAKDEFISRNNISDLIDLLNNIRVSLSLDPVAGSSESLNLEQYLNNDARHFICSRNGCVSFISQNAMDSVFLAFKDLFKLKKILFGLLLVNRRFLVRYCRTAEYKEKKNELCVHLSSCQTKLFLFCLGPDIIDHPVLEDKTTHAIVCKRYNVPPEVSKIGHEAINSFVKHLQNGKQSFYHARGMVVGCAGAGKTTLLERMKRRNISDSENETRAIHVNEHMFFIQKDKLFVRRLCETMIDIGVKDNTINRRLSERTISMLDFAGQCGYYASHHIYFNSRSFFILVMDLTKSLYSVVEDTGNEGTIFEQWTYKEFVLFWMKSIHTYSSESAPVIIVWTHADKVENAEEEMSKSFEQIKEMLKNNDPILLRHICKSMCFWTGMPIKKFLLWECDPFRETIEKIKKGIIGTSLQLDHWGMEIQNLWAIVERHIKEARGRSLKIMYVQDLWIQNEDIYTTLHMKEKSELEKILIFFHEVGEILYFPEKGLNEFAILDIQWFSDAFKYIITDLRHAYSDLEDDIKNHADYTFFTRSGEMSFRLLEKIWDSFKRENFLEYQKELTKYMERLGMLTRITVFRKDIRASYKVRQRWYVPCMNRRIFNCDDFITYSAVSSILCFEFQFLPNMLFYKLISSCMDTEWRILTDSKNKCLYQRVAVFYRFDCFIFVGISRNRIEVQVRNLEEHASRKQRADIRAELERKFYHIRDNFHSDLHFQIGYMCSNTKFCDSNCADMLPESIAQQRVLCNLCPVPVKHYISVSDLSWKPEHDCAKFFLPGAEITDHRDFELLLDVVAGKVSSDMRMIAASLSLDQDAVEQILQDRLHFFVHERNFQVLYHWRNKHRGVIDILYRALIDNDRADIVQFLKNFSRNHYKCPGVIDPGLEMTSTDIRLVSREILHEYTRLARFLRLPQQKIERIKMKFRYNINDCIMPTLDLLRKCYKAGFM